MMVLLGAALAAIVLLGYTLFVMASPSDQWFTFGSYNFDFHYERTKKEFNAMYILYVSKKGRRKVEFRCSQEDYFGAVKKLSRTCNGYILHIQPWLEGTIDNETLIKISGKSFKVAAVDYANLVDGSK